MRYAGKTLCFDHTYQGWLQILQNVDFDQNEDERSGESNAIWRAYFWQSCTEFGFFQTTNQEEQTLDSVHLGLLSTVKRRVPMPLEQALLLKRFNRQ